MMSFFFLVDGALDYPSGLSIIYYPPRYEVGWHVVMYVRSLQLPDGAH